MTKQNAIETLRNLFLTIVQDNIVTPEEINAIQDWIDENAFLFVGKEYEQVIIPLQKFIEDGIYTETEIQSTYDLLNIIALKLKEIYG